MSQLGFFIDTKKCTGCKTCQIACKDGHNHPVGVNFRRVYEYSGGKWQHEGQSWRQQVFAYYVSVACNHCSQPVCVASCPVQAIKKRADNGLVIQDLNKCIRCQTCVRVCPYHAPQVNPENGVVSKCDGCLARVLKGAKPFCVESCPQRALDFGDIKELAKKYPHGEHIAPLPSPAATQPNLLVRSGPTARPLGDECGAINNNAEVGAVE